MSELLGWIIVAGLALVIVGLFLLSSQISEHMRVVAHMIVGNKQMLDRLAAVNQTSPEPEIQPEKIIERRALNRRDPINQLMRAIAEDDDCLREGCWAIGRAEERGAVSSTISLLHAPGRRGPAGEAPVGGLISRRSWRRIGRA